MKFGLIEYDGSENPTIILGKDEDAVWVAALEKIEAMYGDRIDVPYPKERTPDAIRAWYAEQWDQSTNPMVTIYENDWVILAS
jgi:hypothetical protein